MKETFKDRLKRVGCGIWWLFGFLCLCCVFLILVGLLMLLVGGESTTSGIIMLSAGSFALLFFVGICIVLPYIQWKKGIEAQPSVSTEKELISKQIILSELYKKAQNKKKFSLPISIAVAVAVFLVYNSYNDLSDLSRLNILIVIEGIVLLLGLCVFISGSKEIKNFSKVKLEFYKRPVAKKTKRIGVDGEQNKYRFKFDGFKGNFEVAEGVGFSDKIKVGDECVLVCYEGENTIIDMFCMKYWDFSEDIIAELK